MIEQILDVIMTIAECDNDTCPGVALTAIGAAFATQGYYLQSAIIGLIGKGGYEVWAVWLYMFSFLVFAIMIVLNGLHIPKNVMWFALGPALFNWMVYTPQSVKGVGWAIGTSYVDDTDQKRVWEIAEPGLRNIDPIKSGELDEADTEEPTNTRTSVDNEIEVAWLFVYWDNIVSGVVAHLADWVGASRLREGNGTSNLGDTDLSNTSSSSSSDGETNLPLMGNLKWGKLQTITQAKISTPALKDAFVEFMTGTCGVELKKALKSDKLAAAKKGDMGATTTVFQSSMNVNQNGSKEAQDLKNKLHLKRIPKPKALRNIVQEPTSSSGTTLGSFLTQEMDTPVTNLKDSDSGIVCDDVFMLLVTGLRWEVGQTYHKLMADLDKGNSSKEDEILGALYYGWRIDGSRDDGFLNSTTSDYGSRISNSELKYFTRNLILDYIIKNEVEFIPNFMKTQYSDQKQAEQAADTHVKSLGSQGKFGEVYTWARMMPYVQGILMFVLAGAYPIVCIIFIIPGCHKVIVTWAAFWAWVKFWDVGFAVVMVIERSLWGMVGNSAKMKVLNGSIYGGIDMVGIDVTCSSSGGGGSSLGSCALPIIKGSSTSTTGSGTGFGEFHNTLNIFDQSLALASSLNYGVSNGYYVYLMAALYMAVPVICGQIILQGKHGVGSLASMMTGGAEKAAGNAAEGAAKSQHAAAITNTVGVAERQAKADGAVGYAMKAMQAGNAAAEAGLSQQYRSSYQKGLENQLGLAKNNMNYERGFEGYGKNFAGIGASLKAGWEHKGAAAFWGMVTVGSGIVGSYGKGWADKGLSRLQSNLSGDRADIEKFINHPIGDGEGNFRSGEIDSMQNVMGVINNPKSSQAEKASAINEHMKQFPVAPTSASAAGKAGTGSDPVPRGIGGSTYEVEKALSLPAHGFGILADMTNLGTVLPMERANIFNAADTNVASFGFGADQSLNKGYEDRMNTMAKYEGDMAGYDMKRDLAGSMQHIAGVFGVNLMPQQKPYDIKGMMGAGEIGQGKTNAKGMFDFFGDENGPGGKFGREISDDMTSLSQFTGSSIGAHVGTNASVLMAVQSPQARAQYTDAASFRGENGGVGSAKWYGEGNANVGTVTERSYDEVGGSSTKLDTGVELDKHGNYK